jgi:hypothetical protein
MDQKSIEICKIVKKFLFSGWIDMFIMNIILEGSDISYNIAQIMWEPQLRILPLMNINIKFVIKTELRPNQRLLRWKTVHYGIHIFLKRNVNLLDI